MTVEATPLFLKVKALLSGKRLITFDEKQLQQQITLILGTAPEFGFFVKEYSLGKAGIVDFFKDGAAIEVKRTGSPMNIYKQLERYANHAEVKEIILITAKKMTLPETICGKPANYYYISNAWL